MKDLLSRIIIIMEVKVELPAVALLEKEAMDGRREVVPTRVSNMVVAEEAVFILVIIVIVLAVLVMTGVCVSPSQLLAI